METRKTWLLVLLSAVLTGRILAAPNPPTLVNYQGVLRSSTDAPLTGTYDMAFRFFDAATGGAEIMVDQHTVAGANAVTVTGGLFDVPLGGGTTSDGSGPGTYTSLDAVFRDHTGVWLEIGIGGETLTPRTRIHSAPYSLSATSAGNTTLFDGHPSSFYLDTTATTQTKAGRVKFDNAAGTGFGVEAFGPQGGGYFGDSNGSGFAYVGYDNHGIYGYGNVMGGYFQDLNASGYSYAGYGDLGIQSGGNEMGGFFYDLNNSGYAYVGNGDYGILSYGNIMGGYFKDRNNSGYSYVGTAEYGIQAFGNEMGGYFTDLNNVAYAHVGWNGAGIKGFGDNVGGVFEDTDSVGFADVAFGPYKVWGSGTVSFVQNHPEQKDRVLVYAAPEGDEVAVYTRGSGRLVKGEARVALGETFALVANPDLGLTAHITPRGDTHLWVHEVSPSEVVVRGPAGADVAFDYIVYGLRIGFEALPIVQVKTQEAYLPLAATFAELEAGQTDTVASSALARFSEEHERLTGAAADLSQAHTLASQINEGREAWVASRAKRETERREADKRAALAEAPAPAPHRLEQPRTPTVAVAAPAPPVEPVAERERPAGTTLVLQAARPTEAGEIVSLDPVHPGLAVKSQTAGEKLIVGCALASGDGAIAIATAGVALCRVDASSASIDVGDLLIASSIEGHAMKHDGSVTTTAILGRAVDPLPVGAGLIRVLLGAR